MVFDSYLDDKQTYRILLLTKDFFWLPILRGPRTMWNILGYTEHPHGTGRSHTGRKGGSACLEQQLETGWCCL